jgi:hypothetical protein
MNKKAVAKELVKVAKLLQAIEFDTQDAYDAYMKEHPEADKSNHSVKKEEKDEHPFLKHKKKLHDKAMEKIREWHKKGPDEEISNDEIIEYNQRGDKKKKNKADKIKRTQDELKKGLKNWVDNHNSMLENGNEKDAKEIKKNIDKVIKKLDLDKDTVYGK